MSKKTDSKLFFSWALEEEVRVTKKRTRMSAISIRPSQKKWKRLRSWLQAQTGDFRFEFQLTETVCKYIKKLMIGCFYRRSILGFGIVCLSAPHWRIRMSWVLRYLRTYQRRNKLNLATSCVFFLCSVLASVKMPRSANSLSISSQSISRASHSSRTLSKWKFARTLTQTSRISLIPSTALSRNWNRLQQLVSLIPTTSSPSTSSSVFAWSVFWKVSLNFESTMFKRWPQPRQ